MPQDPPPSPPPRSTWAYAFYAAMIWGLIAYSLWGPKPPRTTAVALASNCAR